MITNKFKSEGGFPMRITYTYRNYPNAPKLTEKSRRIGLLTHPLYAFLLGMLPGLLLLLIFPATENIALLLAFAGMIAGPVLAPRIRKKLQAKLDAEYAEFLKKA